MSEASLQGKLKYDVEYQAPVDKIHEFWSCSISDLPKISPNIIQNIELVEGSWGNEGCIHKWTYNLDTTSQLSLQKKLKFDAEYKVPVDKIHEFWSSSIGHIPKLCRDTFHNIELVQGRWGNEGCIHKWTFSLDGKVLTCNSMTETLDYEEKCITFNIVGGDLLEPCYKSFKFVVQFTPKDDGGSLGSWYLVYEKLNENAPDPVSLREACIQLNKAIDSYLTQA